MLNPAKLIPPGVALTATGALVDLTHGPWGRETISILDVAHHLSQINRYNGACLRPYSVAEHSLLVVGVLEHTLGQSAPEVLLAGLLHDAHEAYLGDITAPAKHALGDAVLRTEGPLMCEVLERFGALDAYVRHEALITEADRIACATEVERLLSLPRGHALHNAPSRRATWWEPAANASRTWLQWREAYLGAFISLREAASGCAATEATEAILP